MTRKKYRVWVFDVIMNRWRCISHAMTSVEADKMSAKITWQSMKEEANDD